MDDGGPFLGLGASYFTAPWRCKHDPKRLESDLAFIARNSFNYIRILSMVGYHASWSGREIAPVSFTTRDGGKVNAWPDYWEQLRRLVDLAYDQFGIRTQNTIFADAQLMPERETRVAHMRALLDEVVVGREHKIILLEVANEGWQNGFPGEQGVADLREFARFLRERTHVLVSVTSDHDGPASDGPAAFEQVYAGAAADIGTWHFSRDRRTDDGWKPVYDCWEYGARSGMPPVSSNEPIGPGSSVNTEKDPLRLVSAAAFAYVAKLPMFVFHSEAGVLGRSRFEDTPGADQFRSLLGVLPPDLPNWRRNDGKTADAPFTSFANGGANRYWPEAGESKDGCVRNTGARKGDGFICVPIGVRPGGLELQAREDLQFTAFHPLTGQAVISAKMVAGEMIKLPSEPASLILVGKVHLDRERQAQK